jgi:hypothetical protein
MGATKVTPVEVTTDKAPVYPAVLEELLPAAWHRTEQYANNRVECDHGRLKARLRPMRGLNQDRSATVVLAGHALVQNLRRGHYELAVDGPTSRRVAVAFDERLGDLIPAEVGLQPALGRRNATAPSAVVGEPHLDPGAVASLSQSATAAGRRPHPWSDMPDGCITRRPLGERRAEPVSIGGSFVFTGELKRHRPLSVVGCHMRNDLERWGEIR